jgi:hypothetical protein
MAARPLSPRAITSFDWARVAALTRSNCREPASSGLVPGAAASGCWRELSPGAKTQGESLARCNRRLVLHADRRIDHRVRAGRPIPLVRDIRRRFRQRELLLHDHRAMPGICLRSRRLLSSQQPLRRQAHCDGGRPGAPQVITVILAYHCADVRSPRSQLHLGADTRDVLADLARGELAAWLPRSNTRAFSWPQLRCG